MLLLRDVLPHEFFGVYLDTRAATMLAVEVEQIFALHGESGWQRWPGTHKHVMNWWRLVDGRCVGWNENPGRGWSFPVHGRKTV